MHNTTILLLLCSSVALGGCEQLINLDQFEKAPKAKDDGSGGSGVNASRLEPIVPSVDGGIPLGPR